MGFLIGPAFFGLAAWFIWGPVLTEVPHAPRAAYPASRLTMAPRRDILGDPPEILINGFRRTCNDCQKRGVGFVSLMVTQPTCALMIQPVENVATSWG